MLQKKNLIERIQLVQRKSNFLIYLDKNKQYHWKIQEKYNIWKI